MRFCSNEADKIKNGKPEWEFSKKEKKSKCPPVCFFALLFV
jgi:hypothetical protein